MGMAQDYFLLRERSYNLMSWIFATCMVYFLLFVKFLSLFKRQCALECSHVSYVYKRAFSWTSSDGIKDINK